MKINLLIASAALILSACNQTQIADSNRERDSLVSVLNERDSFISEFVSSFNSVEKNLDEVVTKQHIIAVNSENAGELKITQKEKINSEIAAINDLMDQNRKKIAELNHKLKSSSNKNVEIEKLVATLNNEIVKKDAELAELNEKLNSLNAQVAVLQTSVDTLTGQTMAQAQTIDEKNTALHTAYYIIGKSSELQDDKIIDKKGGLLGIGRTSKLSDNLDNSKFTRIDYTTTNNIPVNAEIKIITTHPVNSYTLQKSVKDKDIVENIVITNSELFWSASKYLVVVKN